MIWDIYYGLWRYLILILCGSGELPIGHNNPSPKRVLRYEAELPSCLNHLVSVVLKINDLLLKDFWIELTDQRASIHLVDMVWLILAS